MPNVISILSVMLLGLAVMAFQPSRPSGNNEKEMDKADSSPNDARPTKKIGHSQTDIIVVGDIQYEIEKNGTEKVCFGLNRFCSPKVFLLREITRKLSLISTMCHHGKENPGYLLTLY